MVDGKAYTITLWDTAGAEDYDRLRPLSYPQTDVFLFCFSVTDHSSLEAIETKWYPEIQHHCPGAVIVLCANKIDLRLDESTLEKLSSKGEAPIQTYEGQSEADMHGWPYVECSALTQEGLKKAYEVCIRATSNHLNPNGRAPSSTATSEALKVINHLKLIRLERNREKGDISATQYEARKETLTSYLQQLQEAEYPRL